jgi:hypothetical protein
MVGSGAFSLDQAYRAIDFDTLALLLDDVVVASAPLSSFCRLVNSGGDWRPPSAALLTAIGFADSLKLAQLRNPHQ